jgi:hypothetical protein
VIRIMPISVKSVTGWRRPDRLFSSSYEENSLTSCDGLSRVWVAVSVVVRRYAFRLHLQTPPAALPSHIAGRRPTAATVQPVKTTHVSTEDTLSQ